MKVYHLDPDFRRDPLDGKPYCICCRKQLLDSTEKLTGIAVTVNWEAWLVTEGHNQNELVRAHSTVDAAFENGIMGSGCWKKTKKKPAIVQS